MKPEDLGYFQELDTYKQENGLDAFLIGRVSSEHKERYGVKTSTQEYTCEILGNLRFTAQSRADFPAVGDWIAFSEFEAGKGIIHHIFPRKSVLERKAVGSKSEKQIIATNIDYAFIVQSVNRDFSINRFERYLTLCYESKVAPILVLSKTDLISSEELTHLDQLVKERIKHVPALHLSNVSEEGVQAIKAILEKGKTYCLLGSSGVGKSTLLNLLSNEEWMKTGAISDFTDRGKHVTTHRELIVLEEGGILIDNPGMREIGLTNHSDGLEFAFDSIATLAKNCKFKDCTHTSETGCAVIQALEDRTLDAQSYENYLKMEKENAHFESSLAEKKKKDKDLGKMIKNYKKGNYKSR